jgi:hypothetical protein
VRERLLHQRFLSIGHAECRTDGARPTFEELAGEQLSKKLESEKIQPKGLIIFDYCEDYSNWEAEKSLEQWMKEQRLTGI